MWNPGQCSHEFQYLHLEKQFCRISKNNSHRILGKVLAKSSAGIQGINSDKIPCDKNLSMILIKSWILSWDFKSCHRVTWSAICQYYGKRFHRNLSKILCSKYLLFNFLGRNIIFILKNFKMSCELKIMARRIILFLKWGPRLKKLGRPGQVCSRNCFDWLNSPTFTYLRTDRNTDVKLNSNLLL